MQAFKTNPYIVPAKWVLSLINLTSDDLLTDVSTKTEVDIVGSCMTIELSDDPDHVMSAFGHLWFAHTRDSNLREMIVDTINNIDNARWCELLQLRNDVMRECIRVFMWFTDKPTFVPMVADTIIQDQTSIDLLCNVWYAKEWDLSCGVVFILQHSQSTWQFIATFNETGSCSSRGILKNLSRRANYEQDLWIDMIAVLGTCDSALQYLMHMDELHACGIISTIETINEFGLWKVVFHNNAAMAIIDYIMDFPELVEDDDLSTDNSIGNWMIRMIETSPLIVEYACIKDFERFSNCVFYNPFAIDLIDEWVNLECVPDHVINGLLTIAMSSSKSTAYKALDIIEFGCNSYKEPILKGINRTQWTMLLRGEHTRDFAFLTLEEMQEYDILDDILRELNLTPYWVEIEDGSWAVHNLTANTVENISERFFHELKDMPYLLSFSNWSVLLKTRFGVTLGINNISYVIEQGAVFELLRSPMISKDEIVELCEHTDLFEFCDDVDFDALISREDAYEVDLKKVSIANRAVRQELLMEWHNPQRLCRIADQFNLSFYDYLQLV